jgi:hypothetical protein
MLNSPVLSNIFIVFFNYSFPQPAIPNVEYWPQLIKGAITICVVGISINVSLATLFSRRNGYEVDATQV